MTIEDILFLYSTNDTIGRKFNFVTGDLSGYVQDIFSVSLPGGGRAWKANIIGGGSGGVTEIGDIDGFDKSPNGGSIDNTTLYFQTADLDNPGLIGASGTSQILGADLNFKGIISFTGATVPVIGSDPIVSATGSLVDNSLVRADSTLGKMQGSPITVADTTGGFSVPSLWSVTTGSVIFRIVNPGILLTAGPTATLTPAFQLQTLAQTQSSGVLSNMLFNTVYNQSGTAGRVTLDIQDTETTAGSGIQYFLRLSGGAAGTTERLNIDRLGVITQTITAGTANSVIAGSNYINSTAATSGNQQYSPYSLWQGQGFGTTGSVNRSVAFRGYVVPVQGTTNPSGLLTFESSVNGAAFSNSFTFSTDAIFTINNNSNAFTITNSGTGTNMFNSPGLLQFNTNSTRRGAFSTAGGLGIGSSYSIQNPSAGNLIVEGNIGAGVISILSRFHMGAGTATANTAPLQFTIGVVETTPRAGVMEYSTIGGVPLLTFVRSGTTREVVLTGVVTAGTFVTPITNKAFVVKDVDGTTYNLQLTN